MPETRHKDHHISNNTNGSCDNTKLNGNRNLKTRRKYYHTNKLIVNSVWI